VLGYVWRQLFQRKVRTGLSMLGVSVSVAGVIALISVSEGLRHSFDSYMVKSGADLIVFSRDAADLAFSKIRQSDVDEMRGFSGVEDVSRANFTLLMNPRLGENKMPLVPCFGRFWHERIMQRYPSMLDAGAMPTRRDEILVGSRIAEAVGLKVGQRLKLFTRSHFGIEQYTIAGIFTSDINWENGGFVVDAEVIREETGKKDTYNLLFVYLDQTRLVEFRAWFDEKFPDLISMHPSAFTDRFAGQMEVMEQFIVLITVIAMIVGILGVLNTMMMSVSERTREIGMLRALGWSRGLVVRAILSEGVLLSVVGGVFGLGLGVAGTEALIAFFPGGFLEAFYRPATFAKGGGVALVVGVLAAIYPALRAANLKPVEALRYE